jgi:hypothetical protein
MECFYNYIALRDCSQVEPESGFYINDMSGVSIKRLDKIADSEKKTYALLWESIQKRAAMEMESRILTRFINNWKPTLADSQEKYGYFQDATPLDLGTTLKGLQFFYYPESWTNVYIAFIEVYAVAATTGAVFTIHDGTFGAVEKTVTVDLVQGYNKVNLEYTRSVKATSPLRLFLTYDSSLVQLFKTVPSYLDGSTGDCTTYDTYGELSVTDIELQSDLTGLVSGVGSGISATFNITCSLDSFICSQKHLFKYAWAKLLCAEIYKETTISERVNFFTTFQGEKAEIEMQRCMDDFNRSIGDVLDNIRIPEDGICFECNDQIKAVYGRP